MIKHHDQKQLGDEKAYLTTYFQVTVHPQQKPRQELKQYMKAEIIEKHCLLACSQNHVHLLCYTAQVHPPRDSTAQNGLWTPTENRNQENVTHSCLQSQYDEGNSSIEVPSFHTCQD